MSLADEITDFVRNYFESPAALLTPETDIAVIFGERDPDNFGDFLEDVSKRFGIGHRELRDLTPGADTRPLGPIDIQDSNRLRDVIHEFPESNLELVGWPGGMN